MGDAASTIVNYFKNKKGIAFINVLANISLYCDCSGAGAPEPKIKDIGILASTDPVAIDKASIDLLKTHTDLGTFQLLEQIKFLKGENTIDVAERHGLGKKQYNLIDVDEHDESNNKVDNDDDSDKTLFYIVIGSLSVICFILLISVIVICCLKRKNKYSNIGSVSLVTKEDV